MVKSKAISRHEDVNIAHMLHRQGFESMYDSLSSPLDGIVSIDAESMLKPDFGHRILFAACTCGSAPNFVSIWDSTLCADL